MLKAAYRALRSHTRQLLGTEARLPVSGRQHSLTRLGTGYGGWTFVDSSTLRGSTIVSAGLGEDASFDLAFAAQYDATVVIVDPTPRAVAYFKTLSDPRLIFIEKALWNKTERLKFFAPPNPAHVSYSVVNLQGGPVDNRIEVDAITVDTLIASHGMPPLFKMDIEGAEIEVVLDMMAKGIRPQQMLLEYDELMFPSRGSRARVEAAHGSLLANGYDLIHRDYPANCLYVLRGR